MKILVDGRRVANGEDAFYDSDTCSGYFKKKTISKRLVLHEFFHHLAYAKDWDIAPRKEEIEANKFAKEMASFFVSG